MPDSDHNSKPEASALDLSDSDYTPSLKAPAPRSPTTKRQITSDPQSSRKASTGDNKVIWTPEMRIALYVMHRCWDTKYLKRSRMIVILNVIFKAYLRDKCNLPNGINPDDFDKVGAEWRSHKQEKYKKWAGITGSKTTEQEQAILAMWEPVKTAAKSLGFHDPIHELQHALDEDKSDPEDEPDEADDHFERDEKPDSKEVEQDDVMRTDASGPGFADLQLESPTSFSIRFKNFPLATNYTATVAMSSFKHNNMDAKVEWTRELKQALFILNRCYPHLSNPQRIPILNVMFKDHFTACGLPTGLDPTKQDHHDKVGTAWRASRNPKYAQTYQGIVGEKTEAEEDELVEMFWRVSKVAGNAKRGIEEVLEEDGGKGWADEDEDGDGGEESLGDGEGAKEEEVDDDGGGAADEGEWEDIADEDADTLLDAVDGKTAR